MSVSLQHRISIVLLLLFALLILVTPILANTSGWSFLSTAEGRYLNGENNGVYHTMTAGTLTNSGSIWPTNSVFGSAQSWRFEVWKDNGLFDQFICISDPVTPSTTVNQQVFFSKNCGSISAGNYYLVAYRGASDGRIIAGSGNFST